MELDLAGAHYTLLRCVAARLGGPILPPLTEAQHTLSLGQFSAPYASDVAPGKRLLVRAINCSLEAMRRHLRNTGLFFQHDAHNALLADLDAAKACVLRHAERYLGGLFQPDHRVTHRNKVYFLLEAAESLLARTTIKAIGTGVRQGVGWLHDGIYLPGMAHVPAAQAGACDGLLRLLQTLPEWGPTLTPAPDALLVARPLRAAHAGIACRFRQQLLPPPTLPHAAPPRRGHKRSALPEARAAAAAMGASQPTLSAFLRKKRARLVEPSSGCFLPP